MYQFIRGLSDSMAKERILEDSAQVEGGELNLICVLKLAEAFEMGMTNQQLVNAGGQLSRISEYQSKKRASKQDSRSTKSTNNKPQDNTRCGNCGKGDHTSCLNDRGKNCPAFDQTCMKFQTNGHYASQCRGGPKCSLKPDSNKSDRSKSRDNKSKVNEVKVDDAQPEGEIGTMSGSWMLINGRQVPEQEHIY